VKSFFSITVTLKPAFASRAAVATPPTPAPSNVRSISIIDHSVAWSLPITMAVLCCCFSAIATLNVEREEVHFGEIGGKEYRKVYDVDF
jgi:hypothetical protein